MASATILTQLKAEKDNLDPSFVHCARLLNEGMYEIEDVYRLLIIIVFNLS